jgi:hypothetical protein
LCAPVADGVSCNAPRLGAGGDASSAALRDAGTVERYEGRMTIGSRPSRSVAPATADEAAPQPGTDATPRENGHDEWLLDESLGETFPASDPISPAITPETTGR